MDCRSPSAKEPNLRLFSGNANLPLAEAVAKELGEPLGDLKVGRFSDGEIHVQIKTNVRGDDVFLLQPTCTPVNENVMELLIMLDAFKRASAGRIVVIVPYYGYSRQDKKTYPREPISPKLVANMLSHAGADRIFALDLHAGQVQGFFDMPVDHVPAAPLLAEYIRKKDLPRDQSVVVSPDVGGVERAIIFAEHLGMPLAIIAKRRPRPNSADIVEIIGKVKDKHAVMIDDMIDTGGSITKGAQALVDRGALDVYACCTHAVLSGPAVERLQESCLKEVVVTDTVRIGREKRFAKLHVLSVAPLLARAIESIHHEKSISTIYERLF